MKRSTLRKTRLFLLFLFFFFLLTVDDRRRLCRSISFRVASHKQKAIDIGRKVEHSREQNTFMECKHIISIAFRYNPFSVLYVFNIMFNVFE